MLTPNRLFFSPDKAIYGIHAARGGRVRRRIIPDIRILSEDLPFTRIADGDRVIIHIARRSINNHSR